MRRLEHFWKAFGTVPDLTLTLEEWHEHLGPDYSTGTSFLRPTQELATSFPCAGRLGEGCPRRVVIHGQDDIVAVCGNEPPQCDPLTFQRRDLILCEVDLQGLLREVATLLDLRADESQHVVPAGARSVGLYRSPAGSELPVYLLLPPPDQEPYPALAELLIQTSGSLLVLTPTSSARDARSLALLRGRDSHLLVLEDLVGAQENELATLTPLGTLLDSKPDAGDAEFLFTATHSGWRIRFEGQETQLGAMIGLSYLSILLRNPGEEFTAIQLANTAGDFPTGSAQQVNTVHSPRAFVDENLKSTRLESDPAAPDRQARNEVQQWLQALQEELNEAEQHNDLGRMDRLQEEKESLLLYLQPERKPAGLKKKTQDRVRQNLKYSLRRIRQKDSRLAEHFQTALSVGEPSSYRPHPPIPWQF